MRLRGTCLMMCLVLMLSIVNVASVEEGIMPCYSYTSSIAASLSISDGVAKAAGKITPEDSQHTSITVRLQRKSSSGTWSTISTWTGSNAGGKSEAGGTKSLTSGYDYRVYVTGKVYNSTGTVIETIDKYSATKSY